MVSLPWVVVVVADLFTMSLLRTTVWRVRNMSLIGGSFTVF